MHRLLHGTPASPVNYQSTGRRQRDSRARVHDRKAAPRPSEDRGANTTYELGRT